MIERVYLKGLLSFREVELEFKNSLIVFTGPSGAGKSVLFSGILGIFGYFESEAVISEAVVEREIDLERFGIEGGDEVIFKRIKKNKVRFFINNQAVSKRSVKEISGTFVRYLGVKDPLKESEILRVLDLIAKNDLNKLKKGFQELKGLKKELKGVFEKEKEAKERAEFLKFELEKFYKLSPKEKEFEELLGIKKALSKMEKIHQKALKAEEIFSFEEAVYEFLREVNEDEGFFSSAMNELRVIVENQKERLEELKGIDIEAVLERLGELNSLIKRFGSITGAIDYYKEREKELKELENLSFTKERLKEEILQKEKEVLKEAKKISQKREKALKELNKRVNFYLKKLHLNSGVIEIRKEELREDGIDRVCFKLNGTPLEKLSTGELNRLKVAFLASWIEWGEGGESLFLDEVDANLSGEELISVAETLKLLSKKYQIFAISHHPQLAAVAKQHFLVTKEKGVSKVKELKEKTGEIARIMGVEKERAKEYLKDLTKRLGI